MSFTPRRRRLSAVTAAAAAAALLLSSCAQSQRDDSGDNGGSGSESSVDGNFIFAASSDPKSLDPAFASDGESFRVSRQIFEGLVGVEPDRKSTRLNSRHSGESRMPSSA